MITPHAPQLPMGPGPFIGFPSVMPYPTLSATMATTPGAVNPGMENPLFRRSSSMDAATAAASREREEMALMQQQHQQWLQAMMTAQQNHLELQSQMPHVLLPHGLHPHHPNAPQAFAPPPSHSVEHSQPMFNFPSPEEMAARQRLAAQQQMGLLEHFGMPPPGVLPPGFHPGIVMENMPHSSGRMEEHAGGGAGGGGAAGGMVPTPHFMPAELVAHQQQAALVAAAAGGSPGIPMTAENLMEFQRQFDMMLQQVQEKPELLRHPQIQMMFQQRNRLVAMQQGAAMQEHMLNYQRMQELSLLQQQEMHKQLALSRQGHEDSHRQGQPGIRPGVIMQTSK